MTSSGSVPLQSAALRQSHGAAITWSATSRNSVGVWALLPCSPATVPVQSMNKVVKLKSSRCGAPFQRAHHAVLLSMACSAPQPRPMRVQFAPLLVEVQLTRCCSAPGRFSSPQEPGVLSSCLTLLTFYLFRSGHRRLAYSAAISIPIPPRVCSSSLCSLCAHPQPRRHLPYDGDSDHSCSGPEAPSSRTAPTGEPVETGSRPLHRRAVNAALLEV
ncbi:uncharacterized protein LOC119326247 [Triticum dicoccoides]|uniref:uncharacterized protein LOC119326247 n=1 Tax=Triticum dicoccoides TaxID=85692 RepID=UPI00189109A0|nr:uncharacterized protein LOC119326247 [Triticum dicoccoides]